MQHSFEKLVVWQRSIALAGDVYIFCRDLPDFERFGLASQLRRAVVSVSSNIAEGHNRSAKEFARFIDIAIGSCREVASQLLVAKRLGMGNGHEALVD